MALFEKSDRWISSKYKLPKYGILCAVFFPTGIQRALQEGGIDKAIGPVALAYYRENEGWVYADTSRKLSDDAWKPFSTDIYWQPFSVNFFGYKKIEGDDGC